MKLQEVLRTLMCRAPAPAAVVRSEEASPQGGPSTEEAWTFDGSSAPPMAHRFLLFPARAAGRGGSLRNVGRTGQYYGVKADPFLPPEGALTA